MGVASQRGTAAQGFCRIISRTLLLQWLRSNLNLSLRERRAKGAVRAQPKPQVNRLDCGALEEARHEFLFGLSIISLKEAVHMPNNERMNRCFCARFVANP